MEDYKICPYLLSGLYAGESGSEQGVRNVNSARNEFPESLDYKHNSNRFIDCSVYAHAMICLGERCGKYNQCTGKKS